MITKKELEISNISYTNKDFQTIYPELIDIADKLTDLWSPSSSNESDPGIVLLKNGAFIGDKNNYNCDKNVLENYMPSATQLSSMWKLCDAAGYPIKYYLSATTSIYITPKSEVYNNEGTNSFELTVSNDDNSITYTVIDPISFNGTNSPSLVRAIEGTIHTLTVSGNEDEEKIQLVNLDDNNRIYFPETRVAQNGVYVKTSSDTGFEVWKNETNLNTLEPLTKAFKFGYDSIRELPYIEFPEYISQIIEDGLTIKYIVTKGINGNIKARTLTTLTYTGTNSVFTTNSVNDNLNVTNPYSTLNGRNPQTINEAYNSFKKTIGTFDTLVTSRDYANYIYSLEDSSSNPLVSNVQVADRRTDINYANDIVTFDITDNNLFMISTINETDSSKITPYDLMLYPLKPLSTTSKTIQNYDIAYTRLTNTNTIENLIEDEKSISHNYKELADNDIYAIFNTYALNAVITTNKKVNTYESASILNNITTALINQFNSREVDYGEEIPFDSILSCIQNADENIKNVSLAEPIVTPYVLNAHGDLNKLVYTSENDFYKNLVVKNILAGKVELFDYNKSFNYTYYQTGNTFINDISKLTTQLNLSSTVSDDTGESIFNYKLRPNEVVQIITPLYNTITTYSSGVKYRYTGSTVSEKSNYTLKNGESLEVTYTVGGTPTTTTYGVGTIINPSFNLTQTPSGTTQTLSVTQSINIVKQSSYKFQGEKLTCYWLLKNKDNIIPWDNNTYLLDDGEYFIYTNSNYTALSILGGGTKLQRSDNSILNGKCDKSVTIQNITENGLASFEDLSIWQQVELLNATLTIIDNQIVSLGEGDILGKLAIVGDIKTITNTPKHITSVTYISNGTDGNISTESQIRSRLNINCGPSLPQTLSTYSANDNKVTAEQSILYTNATHTDNPLSNTTLVFSRLLQQTGGENIDVEEYVYDNNTNEFIFKPTLSIMSYSITGSKITTSGDYYVLSTEDFNKTNKSFTITLPTTNEDTRIMMIYMPSGLTKDSNNSVGNISSIQGSNLNTPLITNPNLLKEGVNCIEIDESQGTSIIITLNAVPSETKNIILSPISAIKGVNPQLDLGSSITVDTVISWIQSKDTNGNFYYNHPTINSKEINVDSLSSADAYWDYNNVANKFTLAKIDFGKSKITINKSSLL